MLAFQDLSLGLLCFPTAQHNAETTACSQLTITSLTNIPLLLLVSLLLLPICLSLSTYLPTTYLVVLLTTSE